MASFLSTLDGAALLLLSLLLPIRLLSLFLRRLLSSSDRRLSTRCRPTPTRSLFVLVSAAILVTSIYAFSDPAGLDKKDVDSVSEVEVVSSDMEAEILDLKDQIFRLGSILEENSKKLSLKTELLEENNKIIEAMERDIQYLINEQDKIKKSCTNSHCQKELQDEVRLLKDDSQNLISNIQKMESFAKDSEKRLETLNMEIKKIENIISEQWIQIRQFEQAFQLTKIMVSKVEKKNNPNESPVKNTCKKILQYAEAILVQYAQDINTLKSFLMETSSSFISYASPHLNAVSQVAQQRFNKVYKLVRRIRIRHISDKGVPDTFFMGCSVSKNCLPHAYKHFRSIKSIAHKCHHEVNEFVNRLIESI